MARKIQENRSVADDTHRVRNPYQEMDVPDPNDQTVAEFAAGAKLDGSANDENARAWPLGSAAGGFPSIEGLWFSRWNGGVDPTIPGDAEEKWKPGSGEVRLVKDRVYLRFNWDGGARRGLIDARIEEPRRLVGKYINLTAPAVTRPWVGLVVNNRRIDGCWTNGRLDFRR